MPTPIERLVVVEAYDGGFLFSYHENGELKDSIIVYKKFIAAIHTARKKWPNAKIDLIVKKPPGK